RNHDFDGSLRGLIRQVVIRVASLRVRRRARGGHVVSREMTQGAQAALEQLTRFRTAILPGLRDGESPSALACRLCPPAWRPSPPRGAARCRRAEPSRRATTVCGLGFLIRGVPGGDGGGADPPYRSRT